MSLLIRYVAFFHVAMYTNGKNCTKAKITWHIKTFDFLDALICLEMCLIHGLPTKLVTLRCLRACTTGYC